MRWKIFFLGIVPGKYVAAYPVFIVGDRPERLSFSVSVDDRQFASLGNVEAEPAETTIRRRYVTREVQQRVHQREFRERVLDAYQRHCAVCRLKRSELLDAAHKAGIYVQFVRRPPNSWSTAHRHANDQFEWVMGGRMYIGTGSSVDKEKTVGMPKGSYIHDFANGAHYEGTKDEDLWLLVVGMGPAAPERASN